MQKISIIRVCASDESEITIEEITTILTSTCKPSAKAPSTNQAPLLPTTNVTD